MQFSIFNDNNNRTMEFKIDTRDTYVHIEAPTTDINADMTSALEELVGRLRQNGSRNYLIDLSACQNADTTGLKNMLQIQERCYGDGQSLVSTGISKAVQERAKELGIVELWNAAPTEIEAIDIINMEVLERDLFGEES